MKIAVVKYNAGNVLSVQHALTRLGYSGEVTDDPDALHGADRVIFPGVGEAGSAMEYLRSRGLDRILTSLSQPMLGICLGMQLMCASSEENDTECLGMVQEPVVRIKGSVKVPHIGWNSITNLKGRLFRDVPDGSYVYFVHSYAASPGPDATAITDYGEPFAAALEYKNFYAVQFHPEKSGPIGEKILGNFLNDD